MNKSVLFTFLLLIVSNVYAINKSKFLPKLRIKDSVYKIISKASHVDIYFSYYSGIYTLDKKNSYYNKLLNELQQSQKRKEQITVIINPQKLNIESIGSQN